MQFRTPVAISPSPWTIHHPHRVVMVGSCFVENISEKMRQSGFAVDVNPTGILYNPSSLAGCLTDLLDDRRFAADDLFLHQGAYHSFAHHSRFSATDQQEALQAINERMESSGRFLAQADRIVVTFGSARVYRLASGQVVANCHKLPAAYFIEQRLSVDEIVSEWRVVIERLAAVNPQLRILFTVSPIRHWKDGAHENQLNKSTLLLAVDRLVECYPQCAYFPSYELMMDDLRDYRFYAADMIHPNAIAIDYIWERFAETYFSIETRKLMSEWEHIRRDLSHRPFDPTSEAYRQFREKAQRREQSFLKEHPEFGSAAFY